METEQLLARIERLEKLVLGEAEVRANRFTLLDKNEETCGMLSVEESGTCLLVNDENGKTRAAVTPNGFGLNDENGEILNAFF